MANTWFEFKQFIVHQDLCGMKVSTDACIQGALANEFLKSKSIENALDIGSGTGLLSLMLAQENLNTRITALEIEPDAYKQSKHNFELSTWSDRLEVLHTSAQDFISESPTTFDFIICNPPFFKNHLQSEESKRNLARHNESLAKEDLALCFLKLLKEEGVCCVLLPTNEWEEFENICTALGLLLIIKYKIFPNRKKPANRIVGFWERKNVSTNRSNNELYIRNEDNSYTEQFCLLLNSYY